MPDCEQLSNDLETVYRYFSHYIRTCTSVVVAMLDVVAEGLTDKSMTAMIMESGYLLDIYDRGLSVSFGRVLGRAHETERETIDVSQLLKLFIKNAISEESGVTVRENIDGLSVRCDAYSFKSLFQILLQEGVASSSAELTVSLADDVLSIVPDTGFNEVQPVYRIFASIFAESGINMTYDKHKIDLRFPHESINC